MTSESLFGVKTNFWFLLMSRKRITITINQSLINLLDETIDGAKIRNRSHAIEYLLSKSLLPQVAKAVILAGGRGLKMRPFTYEMPKSLISVKGRPILEHTIELLRENNIRDIVISIGYLGEKIRTYFGDGSRFGVKINYVEQGLNGEAGTGGALAAVRHLINDQAFIMMHGDVLADINLIDLMEFHRNQNKIATMALTTVKDSSPWGVVKLHGMEIKEFREKPKDNENLSRLINAGIYILEPNIFDYFPKRSKSFRLEKVVIPHLAEARQLAGFMFEGKWFDIGTPEIYERVIKEWPK